MAARLTSKDTPKQPCIQLVHDSSPTTESQITAFVHCAQCLDKFKTNGAGMSPATYARLNVGYTAKGFQIWCVRHDCNVDNVRVQLPDK